MAVTAYASGDPLPITNPDVDPTVDLSAVSVPQTVQLYGEAYDTAAPTNTNWTWTWTILDDDSPTGAATLSSAVVQDPTVITPTWRNVRLFLITQNATTTEYSEQDPLLAPDSAFVTVRVLSTTAGLEKLAAGERNYHDKLHTLVAQVETDAGGVGTHTVASHSDTTATGAELETLTDGSNATGLHIHAGTDVGVATTTTSGGVTLEDTGTGSAKVITRERIVLQGSADSSRISSGLAAGQIVPATYETDQAVSGGVAHLIWRAEEDLTLTSWSICLSDGGKSSATHPYKFRLGVASTANAAANAWSDLGAELTGSAVSDGLPLLLTGSLSYSLTAGDFLGVFCLAAPRYVADGESPGGALSAQIFTRREV